MRGASWEHMVVQILRAGAAAWWCGACGRGGVGAGRGVGAGSRGVSGAALGSLGRIAGATGKACRAAR